MKKISIAEFSELADSLKWGYISWSPKTMMNESHTLTSVEVLNVWNLSDNYMLYCIAQYNVGDVKSGIYRDEIFPLLFPIEKIFTNAIGRFWIQLAGYESEKFLELIPSSEKWKA